MKLSHEELVKTLSDLEIPKSKIFLMQKQEELIRDLLFFALENNQLSAIEWTIKFEKKVNNKSCKDIDYVTLCHQDAESFIPISLVELKFVMAPLILKSSVNFELQDKKNKHNTIWYENYKYESGAGIDIEYMLAFADEKRQKGEVVPSIHQVIIMLLPSGPFSADIRPLLQIDLRNWKKEYKQNIPIKDQVCQIMKEQFQQVKSNRLNGEPFQEDFVHHSLGKMYGREIDLVMYVITKE